jgi:tagatose 6-phosphate kinase
MLICVSANPALDSRLSVTALACGAVNRASDVQRMPGGKAVHVALVAKLLGAPASIVGWFGGATGQHCRERLAELGVPTTAVPTRCDTRQNLEILDAAGVATELLEPGGPVQPSEVDALLKASEQLLGCASVPSALVLSGSLPRGAPVELFATLVVMARRRGLATFVDASGAVLAATLGAGPDWIKPNHDEAEKLLGMRIVDSKSAHAATRALRARGARSVVVSRGREGLVALHGNDAFEARAPSIDGRSTVGCGDATLAGLAVALSRGASTAEALRLAAACGSANCLASSPGRLDPRHVEAALAAVEVSQISRACA